MNYSTTTLEDSFVPVPQSTNQNADASVVIAPSHDYTTFENNTSNCIFNCSGNGTSLLWTVDGQSTGSSYVLNKGIQYTPYIISQDGLTVSSQLIVPTTKANNNITVICIVLNSSLNTQSSPPVKLYLQGILLAPQQFNMTVSNSTASLSWVAPNSLQVSTPPQIYHYVLSNNLTNSTKAFNNPTTCNPLAYCNYSLDLRDPFFINVGSDVNGNTTLLDYNGAVEFTLFAVNGAGNGNATTCVLQTKTQIGDVNHPSQSVPLAKNVPCITTAHSNPTDTMPINVVAATAIVPAAVLVAVGILLCISVPMLVIFVQCVTKQKSSPVATIDTSAAINNEYVTQSTFVTQ
ncbi:hypothetical protein EMCRGX_G030370 [Ephydatia muelleri]